MKILPCMYVPAYRCEMAITELVAKGGTAVIDTMGWCILYQYAHVFITSSSLLIILILLIILVIDYRSSMSI